MFGGAPQLPFNLGEALQPRMGGAQQPQSADRQRAEQARKISLADLIRY